MLIKCVFCDEHADCEFEIEGRTVMYCGLDVCAAKITKALKQVGSVAFQHESLRCMHCGQAAHKLVDTDEDEDGIPCCGRMNCELAIHSASDYHGERGS